MVLNWGCHALRHTSCSVVCLWLILLILSILLIKKKKNQEVLIRAVLLAEKEAQCMRVSVCVCVCGCQNWQTNLSQATPILLNRKCSDLEQQKTRSNPREKARAPPPTQTSSLFIYTETPATVKLPPPEFTHATICRGAFNSSQNKDHPPRSQPAQFPHAPPHTHIT